MPKQVKYQDLKNDKYYVIPFVLDMQWIQKLFVILSAEQ